MTAPQPPGMSRNDGIGSSDIAAVLGCNPWRTPWQVWAEKSGAKPPFDGNEATKWGNIMENVIAGAWCEETGRTLWPTPTVARGWWAFASVDRLASTGRFLVRDDPSTCEIIEIKTSRYPDGWGDEGSDIVPDGYRIQVQWQMALTGIKRAELVVLIGGNDFRRYPMQAKPKLQVSMLRQARGWWERHIRDGIEPPMSGTDGEAADIAGLFDGTSGNIVNGGPAADELAGKLKAAREGAADWGKLKKLRENEIKRMIGDDAGVTGPGYKITWKPNKLGVRTLNVKFEN